MKFLVDAQLPARLSQFLNDAGHRAWHTSELSDGNRTSDARLATQADSDGRVVVTKDRDFRDDHLLRRVPRQLLLVTTGNISNATLLALVEANLGAIIEAFSGADFVELGQSALVVHECHQTCSD